MADSADENRKQTTSPDDIPTAAPSRSKPQEAKLWEEFGTPQQQANTMGPAFTPSKLPSMQGENVGLMPKQSLEGFKTMVKTPCARDSFLVGIGAGFAVFSLKGVIGGIKPKKGLWPAANWSVAAFAIFSAGAYEMCQRMRRAEVEGLLEAKELMEKLKEKKQKEKEAAEAAAREAAKQAEEERWRQSWRNPGNWKPW